MTADGLFVFLGLGLIIVVGLYNIITIHLEQKAKEADPEYQKRQRKLHEAVLSEIKDDIAHARKVKKAKQANELRDLGYTENDDDKPRF